MTHNGNVYIKLFSVVELGSYERQVSYERHNGLYRHVKATRSLLTFGQN